MVDAYAFTTGSSIRKSLAEIKKRMFYLFEKIPPLNMLLPNYAERVPIMPMDDHCDEEINEIGCAVDAHLQSIIDARRKLVKRFAGDLFSIPQAFVANAALPFWPHTPQITSSSSSSILSKKLSKKKKPTVLSSSPTTSKPPSTLLKHKTSPARPNLPPQFGHTSTPAVQAGAPLASKKHSNVGVIKPSVQKEKNWSLGVSGAYLRSQRLRPVRVGISKSIERQLLEHNIGMMIMMSDG